MNFPERAAYGLGRIVGVIAHEALSIMWPSKLAGVEARAEAARMLLLGQRLLDEPADRLPLNDGDPDWLQLSVPIISEVLIDHNYVEHPVVDDFGTCRCMINDPYLPTPTLTLIDWLDHAAPIIAKRLAFDPATAVAALWDYQLKQGTP